ncbi:transposase [Streptomyces flaveolus]|uniref:transposase n=1 Tax=Streptomyces flaveolus TaxID=67297 RepID=UPI0036FE9E47
MRRLRRDGRAARHAVGGQGEHHATAVTPAGKKAFDKRLPNTEPKLRELFTKLQAKHGTVLVVALDNLSAHKGADIRRWAKKNKVNLCFTPTYASWTNPIEDHFGPLRQFTVANSNHRNHTAQTRALHAYLRWRNANARHPHVLTAQRREHARIRSAKGIRWGGRLLHVAA